MTGLKKIFCGLTVANILYHHNFYSEEHFKVDAKFNSEFAASLFLPISEFTVCVSIISKFNHKFK